MTEIGTANLKSGNLVVVEADAFKGKRKIKDRWEEDTWEMVHQIMTDRPMWKVTHPPPKLTSSHCIRGWCSLVYKHLSCTGQVYQPHPMQVHLHR